MAQILAIIVKLWMKAVELPTFSAENTSKVQAVLWLSECERKSAGEMYQFGHKCMIY